jgi:hypothetical protein
MFLSITAKGIPANFIFADIDPADMDNNPYGHKQLWT